MTQRDSDGDGRTRRDLLAGLGAAGVAGLAGCTGVLGGGGGDGTATETGGGTTTGGGGTTTSSLADSLRIFHAGSLAEPFAAAEPQFESKYGVDVTREPKGSVASTQKITQQGRWADVLGVSDFRLLRGNDGEDAEDLLPDYGNWYSIFATNAMAIQYREDSPGADEISTDNWWEVLSRDGVTIGHADPAVDPGGYRAVMAQQLGAIEFQGDRLYDDATYQDLRGNSTVPTGTETKLEGQLKAGSLDYAIYYQSIASTTDMPSIDLQPQVDLSKATGTYAEHYAKAEVKTGSGTVTGAPIAYGLTVPSVAKHPGRGAQWVRYFATEPGRGILRNKGLQPVDPIVVPADSESEVPERVMSVATAKSDLGPMSL